MKNIISILSIALIFVSCQQQAHKDYVTLSGTIINKNSDYLGVMSLSMEEVLNPETNKMQIKPEFFAKKISVNEDGTFSDTLKVQLGDYIIFDGKESTDVYLKNGYNLKISIDAKEFDETISYEGNGSEVNNYLAKKTLLHENLINNEALFAMDKASFDAEIESSKNKLKALLDKTQNLDSTLIASYEKQTETMVKDLNNMYEQKQILLGLKGQESPKFIDYENNAGGKTSLDDLKGKYVYIDFWATWCGPCKREIPFLKEVEKAYHNKNIEFVSISIDEVKDHDKWKKMVAEKELGGVQLMADAAWKSQFVQDYAIQGIPRFILIDPNGNIVTPNAPRPSDEKLKNLFKELNI